MGVGIQSEASGEVTKHAGHRLDVHTVLERDGGESVAEVVESDLRDTSPFKYPLEHVVDAVRGDRATIGRGKHILVVGLSLLLPQDFNCLRRNTNCSAGVFGFQRRFYDFAIHSSHLTAHLDNTILPVNVRPLQSEEFAPTQASCQFDVVHLVDTTALSFFQKRTELLGRYRLHFFMFYLGKLAGIGGVGQDDFCATARSIAEEMTWLIFRTVLALRPFGWPLDSILSTLPIVSSFR